MIDMSIIERAKKTLKTLDKDELNVAECLVLASKNKLNTLCQLLEDGGDYKSYRKGFEDGILQVCAILEFKMKNRN